MSEGFEIGEECLRTEPHMMSFRASLPCVSERSVVLGDSKGMVSLAKGVVRLLAALVMDDGGRVCGMGGKVRVRIGLEMERGRSGEEERPIDIIVGAFFLRIVSCLCLTNYTLRIISSGHIVGSAGGVFFIFIQFPSDHILSYRLRSRIILDLQARTCISSYTKLLMASTTVAGSTTSKPPLSALTSSSIRKNGSITLYRPRKSQIHYLNQLTGKTGKHWHAQKSAFRPRAGQTSYSARSTERKAMEAMKAKEKEMKDEKAAEREVDRQTNLPVFTPPVSN